METADDQRFSEDEYLDHELAKSQLTEEEYRRATHGTTPIETWPEEDFSDLFAKRNDGAVK